MGYKQRLSTSRHDILRNSNSAAIHPPGMDFSGTEGMHRNSYISHGIEPKQSDIGYRAFYDLFGSSRLFNFQTTIKRMEVKIIMGAIMATGMVSYIMGIILNLSNWRSSVLFVLGATFMVVRICVYCAKSWQDYRIKEWELEEKKKEKAEK